MKWLLSLTLLLASVMASGQIPMGGITGGSGAAPSAQVFNAFCAQIGTSTNYTTPAIDTTGATAIAITMQSSSGSYTISDNKANGSPTALTLYGAAPAVQIFYYSTPTVGAGHTFTFTRASTDYGTVCVLPMKGITGTNDATGSGFGTGSASTCSPGSISPSTGTHIVITAFAYQNGPLSGVGAPYTLQAHLDGAPSTSYGGAAASLVQNPGSATNPTWTDSASEALACAITSFH